MDLCQVSIESQQPQCPSVSNKLSHMPCRISLGQFVVQGFCDIHLALTIICSSNQNELGERLSIKYTKVRELPGTSTVRRGACRNGRCLFNPEGQEDLKGCGGLGALQAGRIQS